MKLSGLLILFVQLLLTVNGTDYIYYKDVNLYYKFHRNPLIWGLAFYKCRSENATLATPKNQQEVDTIVEIFKRYPKKISAPNYAFIGLHDLYVEGEYLYVNDKPMQLGYYKWKPRESTIHDYFLIGRQGETNNAGATESFPFFCEKRVSRIILPQPSNSSTSEDYVSFPTISKSYKLHLDQRSWGLARTMCVSEGGNLAIIRNKDEEDILKNMFNEPKYNLTLIPGKRFAFVGFHDMFKEGHFITVKGEDFDNLNYWNWNSEAIVGNNLHNCGVFDRITGGLSDYNCNASTVFFCEKSKNSSEFDW